MTDLGDARSELCASMIGAGAIPAGGDETSAPELPLRAIGEPSGGRAACTLSFMQGTPASHSGPKGRECDSCVEHPPRTTNCLKKQIGCERVLASQTNSLASQSEGPRAPARACGAKTASRVDYSSVCSDSLSKLKPATFLSPFLLDRPQLSSRISMRSAHFPSHSLMRSL